MGFQDQMDEFRTVNGWGFTYLIALFEGNAALLPSVEDTVAWADDVEIDAPILADQAQVLPKVTPFGDTIPFRCALSPQMEMLKCFSNEPEGDDLAIKAILDHRAAAAETRAR